MTWEPRYLPEDHETVRRRFWKEFDCGFEWNGPMTLLPARYFRDGGNPPDAEEAQSRRVAPGKTRNTDRSRSGTG